MWRPKSPCVPQAQTIHRRKSPQENEQTDPAERHDSLAEVVPEQALRSAFHRLGQAGQLDGEQLVARQGKLARKKFERDWSDFRGPLHRVFRSSLNKAVKLRILPYNPIAAIDKPKVSKN